MSRYRLAPSAAVELDEIWTYVARQASIKRAERLIGSITDTFVRLADYPLMGAARPTLGVNWRTFPVGNYRIYYRLDRRGKVHILHVRHGAQDERKFFRRA